jgi:hypothetical protein
MTTLNIPVTLKRETDRAFLVSHLIGWASSVEALVEWWWPKSQVQVSATVLTAPVWLADKKLEEARKNGITPWFVNVTVPVVTPPPAAPTTDLSGVITLLQDAKQHLKFPAIRLTASDGTPVVLKVAGDRAKEPGTVNATDGGSYPDNRWFGRIALDGAFKPGRACTTDVIDVLVRLGSDPATVAAEHGKLTGSCSFCRQPLSDERSTEVGYGPVCAKHFGLPWGGNAKAA